jgi:hypothetical protein
MLQDVLKMFLHTGQIPEFTHACQVRVFVGGRLQDNKLGMNHNSYVSHLFFIITVCHSKEQYLVSSRLVVTDYDIFS